MAPKTAKKTVKKVAKKTTKPKIAKKATKAKKTKKATKKKARKVKRVSKIAKGRMAKVMVFKGKKEKTVGGMKKENLTKNKNGRVVSKKASARGKKHPWMAAVAKARSALGVKGFVAIKKGTALYAKAKSFYKAK